jgi:hypothetical protein
MARKAMADDDYNDLVAENTLLTSRLDRITGVASALGDDATDEQLQSALDEIFNLAVPDDDLSDDDLSDDDDASLNEDEDFED